MTILFAGNLSGYMRPGIITSSSSRLDGLRRTGTIVHPLDTTGTYGVKSWFRRLNHRLPIGPSVREMNRKLIQKALEVKPDVVWVDKGYWVYPSTLKELRRTAKFLVHYNTDDLYSDAEYSWLHRRGLRFYDLNLTTNRWNVQEIVKRYGVPALRGGMGHDESTYRADVRTPSTTEPDASPIVFIGHWEPHSEKYVTALIQAGLPIKVWGNAWNRARNQTLRSVSILAPDRYIPVIASAKVALCFLSHRNRNESTMRSFEIPAIGTLLLAERTAEHEYLYQDGIGAALFSDAEELVQKARHYLTRCDERERVAITGHQRCLQHSWQEHMKKEWPIVQTALTSGIHALTSPNVDVPFWPGFRRGLLPGQV